MDNYEDDIKKYVNGELSPAEMHRLEKRALSDPFLAEALEGAESISSAAFSKDLKSIHKKIIPTSNKYIWPLGIAASILLLISLSYLISNYGNPQKTNQLALNDQKEVSPSMQDAPIENSKTESNLLNADKAEENNKVNPSPKTELSASGNRPIKESTAEPLSITADKMATSETLREVETLTESEASQEIKAQSDENEIQGFTELKEESKRVRSEAFKSIQPTQSSSGAAKKRELEVDTLPLARPVNGKEAYDEYLNSNYKYPADAITHKTQGEVTVSFQVRRNGALTDFQVEKSIGYGCEEELIRLIKEGPKWKPAIKNEKQVNSTAKVSFTFKLPD